MYFQFPVAVFQICHWWPWQFCRELLRSLSGLSSVVICLMFFSWLDWSDGFFFFWEPWRSRVTSWHHDWRHRLLTWWMAVHLDFDHLPEVKSHVFLLYKVLFIQPSFLILQEREPWTLVFTGEGLFAYGIWNSSPESHLSSGLGWQSSQLWHRLKLCCEEICLDTASPPSLIPTCFIHFFLFH